MSGTNPVGTFVQTNYQAQTATAYKTNIDNDIAVAKRLINNFAPHERSTPNMKVTLEAGVIFNGIVVTEVASQDTATITAPAVNPRIDRVVIDYTSGVVSVITGAEAASPVPPTLTAGKIPIAQVLLATSTTAITNALITDERADMTPAYVDAALATAKAYADGIAPRNLLVNGAFDWWQAIEATATTIANGVSTYGPDQWYGKNALGTNGVLTISQITGTLNGSKFACKLQITTAPTAAQANGCELYYIFDNKHTQALWYGQTASLMAQIKALGNVTQVGLQFFYKTTEAKVDTAIGSEVLVSVTTGSFALGKIIAQALGTSMTTSGVVGLRIRITAVSSGNTYDINNGFIVEQVAMNVGSAPLTTFNRSDLPSLEWLALQRYYWKTFREGTKPQDAPGGSSERLQGLQAVGASTANPAVFYIRLPVEQRAVGTGTLYNPTAGTTGQIHNDTIAADFTASATTMFRNCIVISGTSPAASAAANLVSVNVVSDARI